VVFWGKISCTTANAWCSILATPAKAQAAWQRQPDSPCGLFVLAAGTAENMVSS
jgi:hypothetical protein